MIRVVRWNGLVLVDFWGDDCVPCKMLEPSIESIYQKYKTKIRVAKANIKYCSRVVQKYNIMSLPTLILFKRGAPVEVFIGVIREVFLSQKIEENI